MAGVSRLGWARALRYALPAVGIMGVAGALGMTRCGRFDNAPAFLAVVVALVSLPNHRVPALFVFLGVWAVILFRPRLPRWLRITVAVGCVLCLVAWSAVLREAKNSAYARMFPVVGFIDRNVAEGEIGLLVTNRASVFLGRDLLPPSNSCLTAEPIAKNGYACFGVSTFVSSASDLSSKTRGSFRRRLAG